ncbi:MAG: accessory factor UbiK family protein [Acetobacteraceae bacterium]|nr:accessory factor UbiK family protein [Acetobacteraceae bacterium]
MPDRPRFFDDFAGVAGGALSALQGMREEMESQMRARVDDAIRRLDLVRRDELDAVAEMAANARAGQEAAEARLSALEARLAAMSSEPAPQDGKPGASEGDAAGAPPASGEPSPPPQDGRPGASEGDTATRPPGSAPGS